jgi:D-3-phosphoglycerate dehydrogenase
MSHRFNVLLTDRAWPDWEIERRILNEAGADLIEARDGAEETLVRLARDCDAIGTCWARVTSNVIAAAPRCRAIARFGIGLDNIDLKAAAARGILVTRVPDYCVEEVADHTLALLLALNRNVAFFHLQTKRGEYNLKAGPPMRRLSGQTLGLIGFGRIGQAVYRMARGLAMKVIAWTRSNDDGGSGCPMHAFNEVLENSDYISIHLPLTDATRGLLGAEALRRLRPTAALINTSRGPLVDHAALERALDSGRLAAAALDVFDPEPPDLSQSLFRNERVVATPHAAFVSEESLIELRTRAARQLADALSGRTPEHVVT